MTLEPGRHRLTRSQSKIAGLGSRVIWGGRCGESIALRARLLHHLDQDLSSFRRIAYHSQECYAGTTHAIWGFASHRNPEAMYRCHGCLLRRDMSKFPGNQNERILVVCVHVLNELG